MFERYIEKARRAIFFARFEASQFGSPYIETEHLLLGILREDKALSMNMLKGVSSVEQIRKEIEDHTLTREKVATSVDLPLSHESKRILNYATKEADTLNEKNITTGHLLLGLLREKGCFAAELLLKRGITLESARNLIPEEGEPAVQSQPQPETVALADFGTDLVQLAAEEELPPLIGREHELERLIRVLCRYEKANAVLVGEVGVGKKSLVNGLAHLIFAGNVPVNLQSVPVIALDVAAIASSVKSRTKLEQNLETIIEQLWQSDTVFFIDGLYRLAQNERFLSLIHIMRPALRRNFIRCIATATPAEYRKAGDFVPWLEELFSAIEVLPFSEAEAVAVLRAVKQPFERFHGVAYSDDALQFAVFHASSYFPNRYLPEKAIDLMDEAGALVQVRREWFPDEIREVQKRMIFMQQQHDSALQNKEFEKARFYTEELKKQREIMEGLRQKYKIDEKTAGTVTRDDIEKIVSQRTGIPIESLRKSHIE
jgi:ATP-dependent Clp protease ATP-binding subunit ClpC